MDESRSWLRTAATLMAIASIVLVLVNAALILRNQGAQAVVNQRQQAINQAAQLSRLGQILIQAVARTAVTSHDDALVSLLERHGIRITQTPNTPAEGAAEPEKKP